MKKIVITRSVDIYDSIYSNARHCGKEESFVEQEKFDERVAEKIRHLREKYDVRCYSIKRHDKNTLTIHNSMGKEVLTMECFDLTDDEIEQYEIALEDKEDAEQERRMNLFENGPNDKSEERSIQIDFNEGSRLDIGSL